MAEEMAHEAQETVELYEEELETTRQDAARRLRAIADQLEAGGSLTLGSDGEAVVAEVPDDVELEIELEREGDETTLELEISWTG